MSRPLFGFRPNLRNKAHRKAWEILQAVPEGRKNAFLVQAILEHEEKEALESTLRRGLWSSRRKTSRSRCWDFSVPYWKNSPKSRKNKKALPVEGAR